MKHILSLALTLTLLILLPSCTPNEADDKQNETDEIPYDTETLDYTETLEIFKENKKEDNDNYPEIVEKLTWDSINALTKKSSDMTSDELREMCVEFFRFNKTAAWTPDDNIKINRYSTGGEDTVEKGKIYGGLPYVSTATGNIYRLMDYMDETTGVVDIKKASENPKLFGAQCSVSAYWAWARCINSVDYSWTYSSVTKNGFVRVGPYTYDDSIKMFSKSYSTEMICKANGKETMFRSYAELLPADGLVYYTSGGHTVMCSSEAVVKYKEDKTIDGEKSYITIIDQGGSWSKRVNDSGDETLIKGSVDAKLNFDTLFKYHYVPFTFSEFLGTDPVEETECSFSHKGDTITPEDLKAASVTSNYGISDIYAVLCSRTGKEVILGVSRAARASKHELSFKNAFGETDLSQYATGNYTVKIVCQLGTGERPTIYKGTLVK